MSFPALPQGAACAFHAGEPHAAYANHVCERCGNFFCEAHACRTRLDAIPMCPACWSLRGQTVKVNATNSESRIFTVAMWLGVASLLPIPALQIGSFIVAIVALVKSFKPETESLRWKALVGLGLTVLGFIIDAALLVIISVLG